MTYNIGVIIGPILGGVLSDLAGTYPDIFGDVEFFKRYPYATPNLLSAFFLFSAMVSTWLCLDEVCSPSQCLFFLLFFWLPELTDQADPRDACRKTRSGPGAGPKTMAVFHRPQQLRCHLHTTAISGWPRC